MIATFVTVISFHEGVSFLEKSSSFMRRLAAAVLAASLALGATLVAAGPASAAGSKTGFRECNSGMRISTSSSTSTAGKPGNVPFTVGHMVLGGDQVSWTTAGYHSFKHNRPGGTWAASTNGTLHAAAAGCTK